MRIELGRLAVPFLALFHLALRLQAVGKVGGDPAMLAADLDGSAEMKFARERAVRFGEDQSQNAMRLRIAGGQTDGVARMNFAFHPFAAREQHEGKLGGGP